MATLEDFYKDLLAWENIPHRPLVHAWPLALVSKIETNIRASVHSGTVIGLRCPIRRGSTNQSIGNQVADYALPKLAANLVDFRITRCSGSGYPDQVLTEIISRLKVPLEVKATSDWNENDSNRRVLTSSSEKIREQFTAPIHHLLLTLLYKISTGFAVVEHVRLDFLQPATAVSIRLEASVNHKILSHGTHPSFVI
ncbi:MAG: hypothetical protein ACOZE5_04790 [Verrucomicrobiota bacterium]